MLFINGEVLVSWSPAPAKQKMRNKSSLSAATYLGHFERYHSHKRRIHSEPCFCRKSILHRWAVVIQNATFGLSKDMGNDKRGPARFDDWRTQGTVLVLEPRFDTKSSIYTSHRKVGRFFVCSQEFSTTPPVVTASG